MARNALCGRDDSVGSGYNDTNTSSDERRLDHEFFYIEIWARGHGFGLSLLALCGVRPHSWELPV